MSFKFTIATVALAAFLDPATGRAQIGGGVFVCANCATEPTQLSIKVMHDLEYAKQLLQYAIQVEHLADAIKNTAHGGPATLTNIANDLNQLAGVVQGGRALAYSLGNQDVVFRQTYPGYQPGYPASTPGGPPIGTYASKYAVWAETSLATTQGILRGAGVQGKLLATEQGVLGIIRALSASNLLNRNDAINVSGQLAAEQVGQLQRLRELQLEDMTSKAAFQGYVIQRQAASEAATQWFFAGGPVTSDGKTYLPGLK
jgi:P-type conjugative transfer protein TrbJ